MTTQTEATITYCEKHPDRETALRCNRCNRLMCTQCAVLTPTGYRCTECVREQKKVFDTAVWRDYVFSALTAAALAALGSAIVPMLGFFSLLLTPVAGTVIAEAVRLVVGRRRSKMLFRAVAAAVVGGSLPMLWRTVMFIYFGGTGFIFGLIWQVVYTFGAASAAYARLSGIQIGK